MKTIININGVETEITLTAEQVALIQKNTIDWNSIKTLQDALNYNGETLEQFNHRTQFDTDRQKASKELEVIVKAVNQGEDFEDGYRYTPYFTVNSSGCLEFYCSHFDYDFFLGSVGLSHALVSREKSDFVGKTFTDIYDRHINGTV